jgi:DNA-binding CsgD family transcriptional regulator
MIDDQRPIEADPAPDERAIEAAVLTIESHRRAENVEGQRHRPALVYVNDGGGSASVSVLVDCYDIERANVVADAIAELLPDATKAIGQARALQGQAESRARHAHSEERDAKSRLDAVLHGRRRLFGEALVRVTETGEAWLLDPVKQEAGFGLRYPALADLWRAHPELRPVRWEDGDLIVDATIALAEGPDERHGVGGTDLTTATLLARRYKLTTREQEVLKRMLAGRSNKDISNDLEVSRETVKWHMHNIFTKSDTASREDLLCLALRLGGDGPDEPDEPDQADESRHAATPSKSWF